VKWEFGNQGPFSSESTTFLASLYSWDDPLHTSSVRRNSKMFQHENKSVVGRISPPPPSRGNRVFLALARSSWTRCSWRRYIVYRRPIRASVPTLAFKLFRTRISIGWLFLLVSVQRGDSPNPIIPVLLGSGVPSPIYRYKSWCWGWCSFYVMANAHSDLAYIIPSGLCARWHGGSEC
jgi:hypothetical protein